MGIMKLRTKWKVIVVCFGLMALACILLAVIDHHISASTDGLIYDRVERIPPKKAALVLGTAKYAHGRENRFYNNRLDAAAVLFKNGKAKAIVVSGDNSREDYDEPTQMKNDLIKRGIPSEYITLDYAGFRTLDSIVRAKEVFDLDDYIIISQKFHCERALYIAQAKGQKAIAFQAEEVSGFFGLKVRLRETAARCKAFLDINLLNTNPRFLGKKEQVIYKEP